MQNFSFLACLEIAEKFVVVVVVVGWCGGVVEWGGVVQTSCRVQLRLKLNKTRCRRASHNK